MTLRSRLAHGHNGDPCATPYPLPLTLYPFPFPLPISPRLPVMIPAMSRLSTADVDAALKDLPGWTREGDLIRKQFVFAGFPEAVAFVSALVPGAEAADHHPDLTISYKRVTVDYTTHSAGGLTEKDLAGARMVEEIAAGRT
jgi:4a-hydroxytetrahydrobiopterin dehydratase